jgi:CMP-N-acetylneuraminic acid synthetase
MKRTGSGASGGKIIAIIPARSGSKGVPGKNIRPVFGYPLIAYSIAAAKLSKKIHRVMVSTDSETIAEVAKRYGAEAPFLRPQHFAQDQSPDIDFVIHALDWMRIHKDQEPELLVNLRVTTPLRDPGIIDAAIQSLASRPGATSLRSVHPLSEPPQKMMGIENGFLVGLFPQETRPEYFNLPRQSFPPAYHPNGYVDIYRPAFVRENNLLHGPKILGFITPVTTEIDRPEDLQYLEFQISRQGHRLLDYLKEHYKQET